MMIAPTKKQCLGTAAKSGPAIYIVALIALTFAAWSVFTDISRQAEIEGVRVAQVAE